MQAFVGGAEASVNIMTTRNAAKDTSMICDEAIESINRLQKKLENIVAASRNADITSESGKAILEKSVPTVVRKVVTKTTELVPTSKEESLQLRCVSETDLAAKTTADITPELNKAIKALIIAATNKKASIFDSSSISFPATMTYAPEKREALSKIIIDPEVVRLEVDLLQLQERKAWCENRAKELRERIVKAAESGLLGAEELARREGIEILKDGVDNLCLNKNERMGEEEDKDNDKEEKEEHKEVSKGKEEYKENDEKKEEQKEFFKKKEEYKENAEEKKEEHKELFETDPRALREIAYRELEEKWHKATAVAHEKFRLQKQAGHSRKSKVEFNKAWEEEKLLARKAHYAKLCINDQKRCYFCEYPGVSQTRRCPRKHEHHKYR